MACAANRENAVKALERRLRPLGPQGTETLDIENRTQNWTAERRISVLIRVWQRNVRKNVTDDLNSLEHVKWPSVFVLESLYSPLSIRFVINELIPVPRSHHGDRDPSVEQGCLLEFRPSRIK